jgi:hypothetical protein
MSTTPLCTSCAKYKSKENGVCGYCARKRKQSVVGPKVKLSGESYYHKSAKAILASWLIEDGFEVAYEYPICNPNKFNAATSLWHQNYTFSTNDDDTMAPFATNNKCHPQPDRQWCKDNELTAAIIFDLVAFKNGKLHTAYEIYHKHKCDAKKIAIMRDLREKSGVDYKIKEISARYILGQIKRPKTIKAMRTF